MTAAKTDGSNSRKSGEERAAMVELGFPLGIRLTHWFNALFTILLIRSGLAIFAAHPKLYWNIHARPTSEWLDLLRKDLPKDRMWCSTDEEVEYPSWLSLPGGPGLGLGRYWHFLTACLWMLSGFLYLTVLFTSPQWQRLVPTSWQIFPAAWRSFVAYITFHLPGPDPPYTERIGAPFNGLQQLSYFAVVFGLAPVMILTGLMQSPTIVGRFPWIETRIMNRQASRSLHFLGMVGFVAFLLVHLVMVLVHGFGHEMGKIVLGEEHTTRPYLAAGLGLAIVAAIVLVNALANVASERKKASTHRVLAALWGPIRNVALHGVRSRQEYPEGMISPFFRINGYPPISAYPQAHGGDSTYERLLADQFADYRLTVDGLVQEPLSLSLDDLRAMPSQAQTTLHHCIQGWTSIGRWGGVPLAEILRRCRPRPEARYVVFRSYGMHEKSGKPYYECIDLEVAGLPQTLLAYELNGEPLPIQHGAPLRVRFETKLGFKMVKYLRSVEFVDDYRKVGEGRGGVREDEQQYDMGAEI